uniref:Putative restriction endonuclease domain-containing protein n=1 Tax=Byssovorax cruenta TaxID=293647 RepID=A0A3S7UZ90_9BACT|nr:hypothetical protein [Byssovorax cruenta]
MAALVSDPAIAAAAPRAPTQEAWDAMTPEEQARVDEALPAAMTEAELMPPEGDPHTTAKSETRDALRGYYDRIGRSVYIAADLTVYYPGERRFSPDVLVVFDVDPRPRMKWNVAKEKRGLDWVLEVHVAGDLRKDLERNVALYAQLGIPEYFIFDRGRLRLSGYYLPDSKARVYRPILPQMGRYRSAILDLDLQIDGERLRFYKGTAELPTPFEMIARLEKLAAERVEFAQQQADLAEQERARADQAEQRRREEQERAAADIAALRAELDRLRRD